ncbi:MAG: hypothetical protein AB8F95_15370 [Bacteroidia bacterium]
MATAAEIMEKIGQMKHPDLLAQAQKYNNVALYDELFSEKGNWERMSKDLGLQSEYKAYLDESYAFNIKQPAERAQMLALVNDYRLFLLVSICFPEDGYLWPLSST